MTLAVPIPKISPAPLKQEGKPMVAYSWGSSQAPHKERRTSVKCMAKGLTLGRSRQSFFFFPPKREDKRRFSSGFTLVEVIVTILMVAIMGAFFIQFMGTAMSKSVRAIENVRDEATGEALMEQIVADYVAEINKDDPSLALETIKGKSYGTGVEMKYVKFNSSGVEEALTPRIKAIH